MSRIIGLHTEITIDSKAKELLNVYVLGLGEGQKCFDEDYFVFSKNLDVPSQSVILDIQSQTGTKKIRFNLAKASLEGVQSFVILAAKKKALIHEALPIRYSVVSEGETFEGNVEIKDNNASTVLIGRLFFSTRENQWMLQDNNKTFKDKIFTTIEKFGLKLVNKEITLSSNNRPGPSVNLYSKLLFGDSRSLTNSRELKMSFLQPDRVTNWSKDGESQTDVVCLMLDSNGHQIEDVKNFFLYYNTPETDGITLDEDNNNMMFLINPSALSPQVTSLVFCMIVNIEKRDSLDGMQSIFVSMEDENECQNFLIPMDSTNKTLTHIIGILSFSNNRQNAHFTSTPKSFSKDISPLIQEFILKPVRELIPIMNPKSSPPKQLEQPKQEEPVSSFNEAKLTKLKKKIKVAYKMYRSDNSLCQECLRINNDLKQTDQLTDDKILEYTRQLNALIQNAESNQSEESVPRKSTPPKEVKKEALDITAAPDIMDSSAPPLPSNDEDTEEEHPTEDEFAIFSELVKNETASSRNMNIVIFPNNIVSESILCTTFSNDEVETNPIRRKSVRNIYKFDESNSSEIKIIFKQDRRG